MRLSFFYVVHVIILAGMLLAGCHPNRVYKKGISLPDHRWKEKQVLNFTPTIEDTSLTYNVYLNFRHVYGFQFQNMKVKVERTSPRGKSEKYDLDFRVAKSADEYLGDCSGDICDLRTPIQKNVKFKEVGEYKYALLHNMMSPTIPNIMEVGVVIDKVPEKK